MKVLLCVTGLLVTLCAAQVDYSNVNLSDYMELCDINSPSRDECFRRSFQAAAKNFQKGVPELAIPTFDPLAYKNLRFSFNNPIILLSSVTIKNFKATGLGKTTVKSVKSKFTNNSMNAIIDVEMPKVFIEGLYKGESRYANINFAPRGYFNFTNTDIKAKIRVAGRTEVRNGETYMIMRKFGGSIEFGDIKTNMEGIFPDPALNQLANELINNNWRAMVAVMMDQLQVVLEPFFLDMVNSFFSVIPVRKMFL